MKKLSILIFILLTLKTHAVHLSSDNSGEVLIFPYYTVNGSYNTLINLTNTTDQAKALRVRFREAANGREVFAFNLYLAAKDVWSAGLFKGSPLQNLTTQLVTNDDSCTVPLLKRGQESNAFYNIYFTGDSEDIYGNGFNRLHEGFIEVIEMGTMTGNSADLAAEFDCLSLNDAWYGTSGDNYWTVDSSTDLLPASGGLAGDVILLNVTEGLSVTQKPTVINDFSNEVLHYAAGQSSPNLADGKNTSTVVTENQQYTMQWSTGFEAVSAVLSASRIANEFALDASINARTAWVVTMPTRSYHLEGISTEGSVTVVPPFTEQDQDLPRYCEEYVLSQIFDREEQMPVPPPGTVMPPITPPPAPKPIPALCYASNNMEVLFEENNETLPLPLGVFSSHFSSTNSESLLTAGHHIVSPYRNGWAEVQFENTMLTKDMSYVVEGLPVIGFSVNTFANLGAQPGLLAQYAGIFPQNRTVTVKPTGTNIDEVSAPMKLADDHVGQVLLYPYYSVRNDLASLITVVNTSDAVKALKVRFLEGRNARTALSFNLYLGAHDVWTAALIGTTSIADFSHVNGLGVGIEFAGQESARIITADTSCTVPAISGQQLLPYDYSGINDDGLLQDMSRVTEGSIEIIEMGTVIGIDADAATHIAGVPDDCDRLKDNWLSEDGRWLNNSEFNLQPPSGKGHLFGSMSIVDVAQGLDLSYTAEAITDFSHQVMHTEPASKLPNLSSADTNTTLIQSSDDRFKTTWDSPLEAVTALFMQSEVSNSFAIEDFIGAKTEWVNFYPTKPFYVDPLVSQSSEALVPFDGLLQQDIGACQDIMIEAYDREGHLDKRDSVLPPPDQSGPQHCWSVNVNQFRRIDRGQGFIFDSLLDLSPYLAFNEESAINQLHSSDSGWARIDYNFYENSRHRLVGTGANGEIHTIYGLPVIGFTAQAYVNSGAQPGLLANYGIVSENIHKRLMIELSEE